MLKKLQFQPGINREMTNLANEGGWYGCDKVRFRAGLPEKIGGWVKASSETTIGIIRSLINWVTLTSDDLLGIGTSKRYYIERGTVLHDITPIRYTHTDSHSFEATNGSSVLTITCANHGAEEGATVIVSGAASGVGGLAAGDINGEWEVTEVVSTSVFKITVSATATSTQTTAISTTLDFLLNIGADVATFGTGWGTGGWGRGGWGSGYSSVLTEQLRLWSHSNYGQDLFFCPRNGAIYHWSPGMDTTTALATRGTALLDDPTANAVPLMASAVLVTDDRHLVAFGTNDIGGSAQDPLLVRWSDQEDYAEWQPAVTNTAGGYRLDTGSFIVAVQKTRQETLVWTDSALYSMQFLGPPYVFGFTPLSRNISILSPQAVARASNMTFWMGQDKFYAYTGNVETLYCTIQADVFGDMNYAQRFQTIAGTNEGYSEVWWFYCSANSQVIDRYVVFNYMEKVWYHGVMTRTAWLDSPLRATPMAAKENMLLYHEVGADDGSVDPPAPIEAFIESSEFDIDDGDRFAFIRRVLHDVTFRDSTVTDPALTFELVSRVNPGVNRLDVVTAPDRKTGTSSIANGHEGDVVAVLPVELHTGESWVRLRGRQIAFRVHSSELGVRWQLGAPRLDFQPDGRR